MFGIGPTELIVILVIGLIVLGPERLPQVAGQVGKAIRDFRRMSDDVTSEFQRTIQFDELTGAAANDAAPPVLAAETIEATAAPNGAADGASNGYTFNLAPQVIPAEEPSTAPPAIPVSADPTEEMPVAALPVATKADPYAGASLLDEPLVEVAPAAESYVYEPTPLPEQPPVELNAEPLATTEASVAQAQDPVADAWDAAITTEATRSLPASEAAVAPERPRIDPGAEVTIREVIEAQVAAEAFRERRRLASYRRTGKGA